MKASGVVGVSRDEQALVLAVEQLRRNGYSGATTYSPLASEQLEEAQAPASPPSPIRFYTLAGGIAGLGFGLALTIGTTLQWPLITGGKPMVSVPAFLVIVFELTMLVAGLATFGSFLVHSRLLKRSAPCGYRPSFSVDQFGVFVPCAEDQREEVQRLLLSAGMEEVFIEGS